jgi:hypothetical protein
LTFQFRRLQDLEDDVKYRFSVAGVKNRHTSPRIRNLINVCWQQLRTIVSLANDGTYLEATAPAALPTTATISGEVYVEVPWPVNASRIYGIRCQTTLATRWYPLKRVPWAAYHDFQYDSLFAGYARTKVARAFCSRSIPKGVETVETTGAIMIMPVPAGGLYRLWYTESWQPQVEDDDLFPGHEEWFEYVIYSVMIKMSGPDADAKKQYPMWAAERKEARDLITSTAIRLEDGVPLEPRDARNDGDDYDLFGGDL